MIKLISNLCELASIKEDWDLLYQQDNNYSPFQSYDYNFISSEIMMNNKCYLYIICYYKEKNKKADAILPLYIDTEGTLRFINDEHTDFSTALIRIDIRTDFSMYEEIYQYIISNKNINRIFLNHLCHRDLLIPYMGYFNCHAKIYRTENYSSFPIYKEDSNKSYIDSFSHLTAKERNRLKNIDKKLTETTFKILNAKNSDQYPEDAINKLMEEMIVKGIRTDIYFNALFKKFIKELYNKGILTIAVLSDCNKIISISFYFQCKNNSLIQWVIIYADKKYNMWNKLCCLKYFYNQGGGIFNFGRGTYGYKVQHFRPVIQNLFCVDIPLTTKAQFNIIKNECISFLKDKLRTIIKK